MVFYFKVVLFEYWFGLFKLLFGFYVPKFDEKNEMIEEMHI